MNIIIITVLRPSLIIIAFFSRRITLLLFRSQAFLFSVYLVLFTILSGVRSFWYTPISNYYCKVRSVQSDCLITVINQIIIIIAVLRATLLKSVTAPAHYYCLK